MLCLLCTTLNSCVPGQQPQPATQQQYRLSVTEESTASANYLKYSLNLARVSEFASLSAVGGKVACEGALTSNCLISEAKTNYAFNLVPDDPANRPGVIIRFNDARSENGYCVYHPPVQDATC